MSFNWGNVTPIKTENVMIHNGEREEPATVFSLTVHFAPVGEGQLLTVGGRSFLPVHEGVSRSGAVFLLPRFI